MNSESNRDLKEDCERIKKTNGIEPDRRKRSRSSGLIALVIGWQQMMHGLRKDLWEFEFFVRWLCMWSHSKRCVFLVCVTVIESLNWQINGDMVSPVAAVTLRNKSVDNEKQLRELTDYICHLETKWLIEATPKLEILLCFFVMCFWCTELMSQHFESSQHWLFSFGIPNVFVVSRPRVLDIELLNGCSFVLEVHAYFAERQLGWFVFLWSVQTV